MDKIRLQELAGVQLDEAMDPKAYHLEVDVDTVSIMYNQKELVNMSVDAWRSLMNQYRTSEKKREGKG